MNIQKGYKKIRIVLLVVLPILATLVWSLHVLCEYQARMNQHLRVALIESAEKYYFENGMFPETIEVLLKWQKNRYPSSGCSTKNPWGHRFIWNTSSNGQEVFFYDLGRDGRIEQNPASQTIVCGETIEHESVLNDFDRDLEVHLLGCNTEKICM